MTTYLLDTNACVALIKNVDPRARRRVQRALTGRHTLLLSSIVVFELSYGVAKSERQEQNRGRLEAFLAGPWERVDFDEDDAREAGEIRAHLQAKGTPIGAYDLLLAGQARRRGATLVTSNAREFARVPGLTWEDWTPPAT